MQSFGSFAKVLAFNQSSRSDVCNFFILLLGKIFLEMIQVNNYEFVVNFFHVSHNLTCYWAIVHKFNRIYQKKIVLICVKNCVIYLKCRYRTSPLGNTMIRKICKNSKEVKTLAFWHMIKQRWSSCIILIRIKLSKSPFLSCTYMKRQMSTY